MRKYINIDDRLYSLLSEYCNLNKININTYIVELISNNLYIEKYGDMNLMLKPKEEDNKKTESILNIQKDNTIENKNWIKADVEIENKCIVLHEDTGNEERINVRDINIIYNELTTERAQEYNIKPNRRKLTSK